MDNDYNIQTLYNSYIIQFFSAAFPAILCNPARVFAVAVAGKELPLVALASRCYQKSKFPMPGFPLLSGLKTCGLIDDLLVDCDWIFLLNGFPFLNRL